ncbi:MAG TPA: AAA family ATPase [Acidimicrobiales bacterium]|nr:AAA family ATPase [Acidimicrobiales bacterium]
MTGPPWAGMAETHSAVVFFAGDRAYKLKKPVDLGFLDFSSREAREAVCHREVELNRRLAPDVYLGVADVAGPDGRPCDHLVVMRRMPPDRRLSSLVAAGADVDDHLRHLAHLLAAFHARAGRSPAADEAAGLRATADRWADNTAGLLPFAGRYVDEADIVAVQAAADRYLDGRRPLFERRVAEGRACDGHGDLLADDIYCLDDGPRVLDCIEFADRFRLGDALADVAFLAMDLERLGRPDLAAAFLAAYRRHADDTWPESLAHHHIAYRAQVRAKVGAIRAAQDEAAPQDAARSLLAMARSHLEAATVRLVLVGGLPGTGKSTLAAGVGDALGAAVLRSDEVRKELAGVGAGPGGPAPGTGAAFGEGLYRPEITGATYAALLARAEVALGLGETVVLDATWTDARRREQARAVAGRGAADLVELRCSAPAAVAAERMRRRAEAGTDPSDATPEVAEAMAAVEDPWPSATTVDTGGDAGVALAAALAALRGR